MSGRDRILEQSTVYSPAQQSRGCGVRRSGKERTAWCNNRRARSDSKTPTRRPNIDTNTHTVGEGGGANQGSEGHNVSSGASQQARASVQHGRGGGGGCREGKQQRRDRSQSRKGMRSRQGRHDRRGLRPAFTRYLPDLPSTVMPPRLICQSAHTMTGTKPSRNPW